MSQVLIGHFGAVNSVAYSGNGRDSISGSDDKTVRLWVLTDIDGSTKGDGFCCLQIFSVKGEARGVASAAKSDSAKLIFRVDDCGVHLGEGCGRPSHVIDMTPFFTAAHWRAPG